MDACTQTERNLDNPIPTDNAIDTTLRYDIGKPCPNVLNRAVMVTGSVTDQLGASAELCDRGINCPFVTLSLISDLQPAKLIAAAQSQLARNQITSLHAVDELNFALQMHQRQARQEKSNETESGNMESPENEMTQEQELATVLSIVKDAANDTLAIDTPQTPRAQGLCIISENTTISNTIIYSQINF